MRGLVSQDNAAYTSGSRSSDEGRRVVAVTGASGFTGGALVERLSREGWHVKALVRDSAKYAAPEGVEVITGPLTSPETLAELVADAEVVVHVAAMFRDEGSREEFFDINYNATQELMSAADAAGVKRMIYCSTIGVHGHVAQTPSNEDAPFNPRDFYQESKLAAERLCARRMEQPGMEVVIVRPASIYGPGDLRMLKMFRMLHKGIFIFVTKGRPNFHPVYIDDLVDGFLKAMTAPQAAGQTFIFAGPEYIPLRDYVALAAKTIDTRAPGWSVPYGLMYGAAVVCETLSRLIGIRPPLHRRRLSFFKHNRAFSTARAEKLLGYRPVVGVREGFARTVDWYRKEGYLPKLKAKTRQSIKSVGRASALKTVAAGTSLDWAMSSGVISLV
ncbi:MAG: NAD-dependent epimerase/dehydratase family protein [Alphaproteobacteria bacterium]